MHLHFEKTINTKSDCSILSLSWMGKVPDEIPEDGGWKLNRTNYYQEGWLATGNIRGIVGVTFTTSHCKKRIDYPLRTNYNLRGHRSEVILVKWNEPYQKLASCDSSGIIFVWIKYEGRWSIELINDRNTPVTYFSWSHDGRMALICYQDGFVLVGSVAGQRYWSSMLNLEGTITCGIWTPDDQQVYFGTTSGQLIVMDVYGAMVSQIQISVESGITSMAWSCEKFKMEESDDNDPGVLNAGERKFVLAVCLQNGIVYLLKAYDDISPVVINTDLQGPLCMEWSNSREILAIGGVEQTLSEPGNKIEYINRLKFYNEKGALCYSTRIPYTQASISSLTWGHNDKRLFVATGTQIHIAWISRRIATLQLLSRLKIYNLIQQEANVSLLPLPARIKNTIGNLFIQTIKCCLPEPKALRQFVSKPPHGSIRLHCTMIRHDDDNNLSSGTCYTLYLEYLGGLVPLLKGKRTSKIRPEFVIFDPQEEENHWNYEPKIFGSTINLMSNGGGLKTDSSDSERDEGCTSSPRLQRKRKERQKRNGRAVPSERYAPSGEAENEDLSYVDTLPEVVPLVEVTSNIWGTKFKIHGFPSMTPANLGQVTYKTSLLHLQPRQMTLTMTELRNDIPEFHDTYFKSKVEEKIDDSKFSKENSFTIAPLLPRENSKAPLQSSSSKSSVVTTAEFSEKIVFAESKDSSVFRPQPSGSAITNIYLNVCHPSARPNSTTNKTVNVNSIRTAISPLCGDGSLPTNQSVSLQSSSQESKNKLDDIIDCDNERGEDVLSRLQSKDSIQKNFNCRGKKTKDQNSNEDCLGTPCNIRTNFGIVDSMVRSWSVGYLDSVEAHFVPNQATLLMLRKEWPRKIVLINKKPKQKRIARTKTRQNGKDICNSQKLINCGKSKSLDSGDICLATDSLYSVHHQLKIDNEISDFVSKKNEENKSSTSSTDSDKNRIEKKENSYLGFFAKRSPLLRRKKNKSGKNQADRCESGESKNEVPLHTQALTNLEKLISKLYEDNKETSVLSSPKISRSSPVSPALSKKHRRPQSASPIRKTLLSSPFLGQRSKKKLQESSDDELTASGDEIYSREHFKDLETFQKRQLRQKLKNGKSEQNGKNFRNHLAPQRREFVMHNKAPMWNENSQVYQLDFGGRVTQESAKNFQIEFKGKQVMQFGRIDGNAYTLDFQYPFSALQAFSVALANVTQRLK